ncbi:anti-sigma factor [Streptomyces sp. TLI_171]|uniref:anti-sigma factor n=1 Tax=Streptomyces sp. TLI_171 TaxID=1938859 RepID=UPI000C19E6BA|nr:anti-sigma factor [Streptomyces sp. TLI_171]RKE20991.1 putative zinc finger protein [Streptomyces sp. TLI_171]
MSDRAPERADAPGRSRWAPLRRVEPAAPPAPDLRPVALRPVEPAAEEHHLGDRLTAYLDGELGHDARERVQAHLATCADCLAEAEDARAVKRTLSGAGTPGPSAALMARLMSVAALPEDEPGPDGPSGSGGVFGGSRLTGGSFGRGAGFGGGALGADAPIPGIDPRAGLFGSRPSAAPRRDPAAMPRPLAALGELPTARPQPARGRRLVFAAAGAFSVAAVTLGGVGGVTAGQGTTRQPTSVTPVGGAIVPVNAQQPAADVQEYPLRTRAQASAPPSPTGDPRQLLR